MTDRKRKDGAIATRSLVSIVDDDESVRDSLPDLLRQLGHQTKAAGSNAIGADQDSMREGQR